MQREYDGVHFYGRYDRTTAYILEEAVPLLDGFDETESGRSINEITELYGIARALEAKNTLPTWDDETVRKYQAIGKRIRAMAGRFAAQIDNQSILRDVQELDGLYLPDFLDLIEHYGVYKRISGGTFSLLLGAEVRVVLCVLRHKELVTHFGQQIADYMTAHSESGAWLVEHFLLAKEHKDREKVFFPKELSLAQRDDILMQYVESDQCNLNILNVLQTSWGVRELPVSDMLRLKARRKHEKMTEEHFAHYPGIEQKIQVGFYSGMELAKEEWYDKKENIGYAKYSSDWVSDNKDYPTLLNNFIYLFGYTDIFFRSSFPALRSQAGFADMLFQTRGAGDYQTNHFSHTADTLSSMQMMAYYHELECHGIDLEEIIQWFFETYLPNEFNGVQIKYNVPTKGASLLEKNRMLAPELEGALKQYYFYCKYGEIDLELLEVSTLQVDFSALPSMQTKKYIYPINQKCQTILHFLFSPHSWLPGKEDSNGEMLPFGQAVLQGLVSADDLSSIDMPIVEELRQKGIINISEDGVISGDPAKIAIYRQLYDKEVLCYPYCGKWASIVDDIANQGEVRFGATLFSEPEQHYMNFMLNNKEYSNGLSLRNKYAHCGYPRDEKQQRADYFQLLKITVLAIIKINEEFCLRFPERESSKEDERE